MRLKLSLISFLACISPALSQTCDGPIRSIGNQNALFLPDGGIALRARMNINIDGSARAYHRDNYAGGALIHLCNAGEVFLPNGSRYQGSADNATCTGRFMADYARIRSAGWRDPSVGAIRWFGILGRGNLIVGSRTVRGVTPVEQPDGSGYYVSPTTLFDPQYDEADQRRYVEPLAVPAAVVRNSQALRQRSVVAGTLGVAIHRTRRVPVPFIVGDTGPRIGEGTPALARLASGLPIKEDITRAERYVGQVDAPDIVWVFFGGHVLPPPYDAFSVRARADQAFQGWGGNARLQNCISNPRLPIN